jgi:hypothetical protein
VNTNEKSESITIPKNDEQILTKNRESFWSIIFKWIKNILIAGCIAYAAYKFLIKV